MAAVSRPLNFDPLARPYRWLEYLTFGRTLERCRFYFLPELIHARRALVLGDGDGRFVARLLESNHAIKADIVDVSPAMLAVLKKRLQPEMRSRVTLHQADTREFTPPAAGYDLVVTHFFLDCLFEAELTALIDRIRPQLAPGARWIVSEFARPQKGLSALAGDIVVSGLYLTFGILTGLPVRSLPDHETALKRAGFDCREEHPWLRGLLISQLWEDSRN